jgi:hypothetical protein
VGEHNRSLKGALQGPDYYGPPLVHSIDLLVGPTSVAAQFDRSNIVIEALYPTRGMNVRVLSVFVMSLPFTYPPHKESYKCVLNDVHILNLEQAREPNR